MRDSISVMGPVDIWVELRYEIRHREEVEVEEAVIVEVLGVAGLAVLTRVLQSLHL